MKRPIDRHRVGPWALVSGASSGIGVAGARQLAATDVGTVIGNAGAATSRPLLDAGSARRVGMAS